jgi:CheY-like chemotaxis protein
MSLESCKVLVIDDERDGADSAVMLLRMWGHEAVAAYSPDEAIKIGREFQPDVVLVDIGLPRKNGFEVAKELKECCPGARFVALTGFTQADIVRRARQDGFSDHLIKPAQPSVLKRVVDDQCATGGSTK